MTAELQKPESVQNFEDRFRTKTMFQDQRAIHSIEDLSKKDGLFFMVGVNGTTAIEIYGEPGNFSMIPYLAVYRGDEILLRAPAQAFAIHYRCRASTQGEK